MPRRTGKQIRLDTIAELKDNGRLDLPAIRKAEPVPKGKRLPTQGYCCIDRYGNALPKAFRPCIDCPKPKEHHG